MKQLFKAIRITILSLSVLLAGMALSARRTTVKKHSMHLGSQRADSEMNVFFISDIHRRRIPQKLLRKVQGEKSAVDLVIIGGDLAEKGVPVERVQKNVKDLSALGPIYYVWGNNDREIGEQLIRDLIMEVGGKILDNESIRIDSHPDWIITGADDPSSGNANLQKSVSFDGEFLYRLAVVHNPSAFSKFVKLAAPSLLVGGHTHGGQIRLGPYGMQPRGSFEEIGDRAELISNGYGTTLVPLRFGAPPETHLISISYKKRSGTKEYDED